MPDRKCAPRQPAELRVRGVRLFKENRPDCSSCSAAYASIAEKLGCSRFPLREWCIQAEREVKELRTANEILKNASACFARAGALPHVPRMISFIEEHREAAESGRSAAFC